MKKVKRKKFFYVTISFILVVIIIIAEFIFFNSKSRNLNSLASSYMKEQNLTLEMKKFKKEKSFSLFNSYYIKYPYFNSKKLDKEITNIKNKIKKDSKTKFSLKKLKLAFQNKFEYQFINYELFLAPDRNIGIAFVETKINNKGKVIFEKIYTYNFAIDLEEKLKDSYIFVGDYKVIITQYIKKYIDNNQNLKNKLINNYQDILNKDYNYKYVITNEGINVYFNSNEITKENKFLRIVIPYSEISSVININTENKLNKYSKKKVNQEDYIINDKIMYVKKLCNFYKKGDKNSKLLDTLKKGTKIKVSESNNLFSKITYQNKIGYVLNKCLSENIIAKENFIDVNEKVYVSSNVEIKKDDNKDSESLGSVSYADSITRIGTSDNGWSAVIFNDEIGYIESSELSLTKSFVYSDVKINKNKSINPKRGMVALTFDDGPGNSTERILATLSKYNAVATFFDLGRQAEIYPNIVKKEEASGCEVASHTYSHANLNKMSAEDISIEMNKSSQVFRKILGHDVSLVRTPYGNVNETVRANIHYPIILWNIDTLDWKNKDKNEILKEFRVTDNYDGKIILMHSIYESTADAVEVMVPELINKGYQLVTISEMAYYKGIALNSGQKYYSF